MNGHLLYVLCLFLYFLFTILALIVDGCVMTLRFFYNMA